VNPGVLALHANEMPRPVRVLFDGAKLQVRLEERSLTDSGLRRDWGERITRILLIRTKPPLEDEWNIRFVSVE
jgi:hypothetical protein